MSRHHLRLTAAAAAALLLAGCGANQPASEPEGQASPAGRALTVFAAASLKSSFTEIGKDFEAANPGTTVTFNFAGSSDLVTQITQGAPADVFASADTKNMDKATAAGVVAGSPTLFASNTLEIAVPPDNPAEIAGLRDLTKQGVRVVLCAPQVPCGSAAQAVETAAKIDIKPVSEENSVTDVVNKVASGEADAGLVYVTDVQAQAGKVTGITFPESTAAVNQYPIAALSGSSNAELARAFVAQVTGSAGQQVLADAGFAKPTT